MGNQKEENEMRLYGSTFGKDQETIRQLLDGMQQDLISGKVAYFVVMATGGKSEKKKAPIHVKREIEGLSDEALTEAERKEQARKKAVQEKARSLAEAIQKIRAGKDK